MDRTDEEEGTSTATNDDGGRMPARTWTIAANFHSPAEYGVPTAPSFEPERCADGVLVLVASDGTTPVLTAKRASRVQR